MQTLVTDERTNISAPPRGPGSDERTKRQGSSQARNRRRSRVTAACVAFLVVVPTTLVLGLAVAGSGGSSPTSTPSCVQAGYPANIKTCHVK
jgi:hypothetical protein